MKLTLLKSLILLIFLTLPLALVAEPVNVNSADADTLARSLWGIGPAKARAIITHREENGPFATVDDLIRVRGIGPKTMERIRDDILLGNEKSSTGKK